VRSLGLPAFDVPVELPLALAVDPLELLPLEPLLPLLVLESPDFKQPVTVTALRSLTAPRRGCRT